MLGLEFTIRDPASDWLLVTFQGRLLLNFTGGNPNHWNFRENMLVSGTEYQREGYFDMKSVLEATKMCDESPTS